MNDLIGKRVRIEWTDEGDWPNFHVIAVDGNHIRLQGVDDDEGHHHEGDVFWVNKDRIGMIEEAPL